MMRIVVSTAHSPVRRPRDDSIQLTHTHPDIDATKAADCEGGRRKEVGTLERTRSGSSVSCPGLHAFPAAAIPFVFVPRGVAACFLRGCVIVWSYARRMREVMRRRGGDWEARVVRWGGRCLFFSALFFFFFCVASLVARRFRGAMSSCAIMAGRWAVSHAWHVSSAGTAIGVARCRPSIHGAHGGGACGCCWSWFGRRDVPSLSGTFHGRTWCDIESGNITKV